MKWRVITRNLTFVGVREMVESILRSSFLKTSAANSYMRLLLPFESVL